MKKLLMSVFLLAVVSAAYANGESPYAGLEARKIKALSAEDTRHYLDGAGMGFSLAAELNHYPGPKHVLEIGKELGLNDEQLAETRAVRQLMQGEAERLGRQIVEKELELDEMFAEQSVDEEALESTVAAIARLKGELRFVHLKAHLSMKSILTDEQITNYDRLRGYLHGLGDHKH